MDAAVLAERCRASTLCGQDIATVRKLTFIVFVALGVVVGLVSAAKDDWATRAVMMGIGALFGAGVGGGLTRLRPVAWMTASSKRTNRRACSAALREVNARRFLTVVHSR
jgi:hypothetical protein